MRQVLPFVDKGPAFLSTSGGNARGAWGLFSPKALIRSMNAGIVDNLEIMTRAADSDITNWPIEVCWCMLLRQISTLSNSEELCHLH